MTVSRVNVLAVLSLVCLLSSAASAQELNSDSLPFRKGQWGVDFRPRDFFAVGVLRFSSPRAALTFDGHLDVGGGANDDDRFSPYQSTYNQQSIGVRFGRRSYRPLARAVASHVGGGLSTGFSHFRNESGAASGTNVEDGMSGTVGIFAEVGASYFVTTHLSLGVTAGPAAYYSYSVRKSSGPSGSTRSVNQNYFAGIGSITVAGSLYF